ncbi:MAG: DsbA family protein [Candidatus Puniceispirillaceae bacterium]
MKPILLSATALFAGYLAVAGLAKPVYAELAAAEKQEIEALIESFIKENPELLRDALTRLAEAEAMAAQQAAMDLVHDDRGDPYIGAENPNLIIYEFSDYNCGYCKRVFPDLMAILDDDPSLRLVLKEFPILAESSVLGARAAIAAQRQQKFPAFHAEMMGWRGRLDADAINRMASSVGLDTAQLQIDMQDPVTDIILNRTRQAAAALDLRGTPALVIGNNIVPGAISRDEILNLIKQARADKNS